MNIRIESYDARTGALQHVEEGLDAMEAFIYCTTAWRSASVHMAYMITAKGSQLWRAYAGGRCITPHLK